LTGVPDEGFIIQIQIPASGEVTVPLIKDHAFRAAGRAPADLASDIMATYKAEKIYTTPVITITQDVRYVSVGGDVRNPQRVVYTSDLTLLGAINACGGFTEYAKKNAVRVLRGQQVIIVDATKAAKVSGADPHLQVGDQVYVPRTVF